MSPRRVTTVLLASALLAGCAMAERVWPGRGGGPPTPAAAPTAGTAHPPPRFAGPGDHELTLEHGGLRRTFVVRLPVLYRERVPLPVVLALHGAGSSAAEFKRYAGLDRLGHRDEWVVVYPEGTAESGRRGLTWNAGACCGWARAQRVDDVGFLVALLHDLARDLPLDRTRVYATGHSNGAMMAYRLAAEAPGRLAAVAAVAGPMVTDGFAPTRPLPVLHVHSVDDPHVPFAGGTAEAFSFAPLSSLQALFTMQHEMVEFPAVEAGLERWIAHNRCPDRPEVADRRETFRERLTSPQSATLLVWGPCAAGTEVRLWRMSGVGHGWPGQASPVPESIMGPDTNLIGAGAEAWRFFARFRRPDAPRL